MDDVLELGTEFAVWAIKGFSVQLREAIGQRARQADCTTAEWLHAYFQRHSLDGVQINQVKIIPAEPGDAKMLLEIVSLGKDAPGWLRAGASRKLGAMIGVAPPAKPPRKITPPSNPTGLLASPDA